MNKLAKKLLVAALAAMASSSVLAAADSYLYWMVDPDVYNWLDTTHIPIEYSYAKVNIGGNVDKDGNVTGGTWLSPYFGGSPISDGTGVLDKLPKDAASNGPLYWGAITSEMAGNSFIFELFVGEGEEMQLVGWNSASYSEVLKAIASGENPTGSTAYRLTTVVPEPTSGLLSMFGLAMLALRRRRRA